LGLVKKSINLLRGFSIKLNHLINSILNILKSLIIIQSYNKNLKIISSNKMDSDGDDDQQEFAKQGGDALNLDGDNDAFNDSEDADDIDDEDEAPQKKESGSKSGNMPAKEVKGDKLENQPYDLAVDVNDSEEIESDEEDDEVNMNDVGRSTQNQQQTAQAQA